MMRELTGKQQIFVDCYDGDAKKAAKTAKLSYDYARRLVTKGHILKAIRNRIDNEIRPSMIASRQERQKFWSEIMNDKNQTMKDRLRASELLGKSEMDFPNKMEVSGVGGEPIPVTIIDYSKVDLGKMKKKQDKQE